MGQVKVIHFEETLAGVELASETGPGGPGAEGMLCVTAEELEAAKAEGYRRGFEDASAMIETQLLEQREEVLHLQQKTLQGLTSHQADLTRQFRAAVPEMTMEIVRRVLGGTEPDQAAVVRIVDEVLHSIAPGQEAVEVCLSGRDLKLMESYEGGLKERYPQIEFRVDSQLQAGDCMVTSRFGTLDGRVATKLRSVERLLQ